jgi:aryl-alcohol dehydrogenase-like predicted oxidoreductase
MLYRTFGRLGWRVGEVGYGMWGMAGWTGSDDEQSRASLEEAVARGCNFFDTAWAYGAGHSEKLLGDLIRAHPEQKLYVATKIPPRNRTWPSRRGFALEEVFPPEYIREYTERSLENLAIDRIDLMQFHVWEDAWAQDERWQRAMDDLREEGLISGVGISVNRWEPWNGLDTIRTGAVDSVQVIYNIFDQAPEDELLPLCRDLGVAVIARVPFDEGSLAGNLTHETTWPEDDWRNIYFGEANLGPTVDRVDALRPDIPAGMTMPEAALRFILSNPDIATVIPGMRKLEHVRANTDVSDGAPLAPEALARLRSHRWDREPAEWSL